MEQVVSTVEEDVGKLGEESLKVIPDDLFLLFVDEGEDNLTGAVSIRPLLHLDGVLHLGLAELEQEFLAVRVVQLHWVRNLGVDEGLWVFLSLDKLLEVIVKSVGKTAVFSLALELEAEREKIACNLIVLVQKFGVLAECVHDNLGDRGVELDPWDKTVLVNDVLDLAVGEKQKLIRGGIDLLGHVGLLRRIGGFGARVSLVDNVCQFLNAVRLLDLSHDLVILLDQVADHRLKQTHRGVLAGVSEMI
mgnify:CR=1 FL=1